MNEHFDIAVIGSGPGGCTAATFLAQKGYRVLMIEREKFPRFHIGESLLSASQDIWERLGLAEQLQHSGHTFKYGGQFRVAHSPNDTCFTSSTVYFHKIPKADLGPRPFAYHVERAVFDQQLQDNAVSQGVELWNQTTVEEVLFDPGPTGQRATGLRVRREGSERQEVSADFIIDASGRRCLIARQLNCVEKDPIVKTSAVFGHFRGVQREEGYQQGLFRGYFVENGWFWLIPLADDIMSVGFVQNEPQTLEWSNNPEEVLLDAINRYRFVQQHFENATQVGRVRSFKDMAYTTREFCGDGWLSIGDANFFVDPLYSSGVHVAHDTGDVAADVVDEFLRNGRDQKSLDRYEKYINRYRRNVFSIIYVVYAMLQNYVAMRIFGWIAGQWGRNFDTWMLRRVASWSSGFFNRHAGVMRIVEISTGVTASVVPRLCRLFNWDGWKNYARKQNSHPPLEIPKEESQDAATPSRAPIQRAAAKSDTTQMLASTIES